VLITALDSPDLYHARMQMALSLGWHIIIACFGVGFPAMVLFAEWRSVRRGDADLSALARTWSKAMGVLFAVGAVSGTILSFEMGMLWPGLMDRFGEVYGFPFTLEGFAFFLEAIFLGLYLYGWDKLSPRVHLACGIGVAISGMASAVFVTAVNAWMNEPVGVPLAPGADVDPWVAFASPVFLNEAVHVALASYTAVAFAVLGIHAARLRKQPNDPLHRRALSLALGLAIVSTPLLVFSGDRSAKHIAVHQPVKLAAAEGLYHTTEGAPFTVAGWPDDEAERMRGGLEIPYLLSLLAHADPNAEVIGLDAVAPELRPPVGVVHLAFDVMVGSGTVMLLFALWGAWLSWRARPPPWQHRRFLAIAPWVAPLGLVAIEAGWTVTEVGRQPWIVRGVMLTADAVTPMQGLVVPLVTFTALYMFLGVVVLVLLRAHVLAPTPRVTGVEP
jgi:cytochrome d ubiquinol oxidase subunit I